MADLKPCPFCGSTKVGVRCKSRLAGWTGIDARVEVETYSVRCNACHARGATVSGKVITSHKQLYINRIEVPKIRVEPHEVVTLGELTKIPYTHELDPDYELLLERYRNMLRDRLVYQLGAYINYEGQRTAWGDIEMRATLRVLQRK